MNAGPKYRKNAGSFAALALAMLLLMALPTTSSAFSTSQPSLNFAHQPRQTLGVSFPRNDHTAIVHSMSNFAAHARSMSTTDGNQSNNNNNNSNRPSLRKRLRQITGFSLTAFRATMRAATGISLSGFVRKTMTLLLSPFPPWFRYFLQPFLILYYAPLFILRNLTGPTDKRAKETHTLFVDGFRTAVDAAEKKADGYWPVHVNEDGDIIHVEESVNEKEYDITEGVAESMEVVMDGKSDSDMDGQ